MPNEILKYFDVYKKSKSFLEMSEQLNSQQSRDAFLADAWKIWHAGWIAAWGGVEDA